ncbi:cell wall hydrolase [Streptomyces sp. NPDC101227]|uniref:cell wall hydrolase n=1 Tax=Streptomyces sp. NPDC101227 TaxID=3366136 RepID=UPI00380816C1
MASPSYRQIPVPCGEEALARLPEVFRNVSYSVARHPGAGAPECPSPGGDPAAGLAGGANCQRYAYAVLRHFGLVVPPLRSAELWADELATVRVERPRPLDLVLFDGGPVEGRPVGYGAHVGVHLAPDQVLHLCKEVGRPAVWTYGDFAARPRYARFLGAKRAVVAGTEG